MPNRYEWSGRALRSELLYDAFSTECGDENKQDVDNDKVDGDDDNEQLILMEKYGPNSRLMIDKITPKQQKKAMMTERMNHYKINKGKEDDESYFKEDDVGGYHSPDQLARLRRLRRLRMSSSPCGSGFVDGESGGTISPLASSSLESCKRADGRW